MAKKKELTVEERLRALYDLQLIDSRVDEIRNVRGELPLEVRDLEDEVEGFKLRLQKFEENLTDIDNQIKAKKKLIEESKSLIKKYNEQQKNVRNNREFNSLAKEIEFQGKKTHYALYKGNKNNLPYQSLHSFIKIDEMSFLKVKIDLYGKEEIQERLCKALSIIDQIKILEL